MSGGHIQQALTDGIATLTICHPERRNAMTLAMWQQLAQALYQLREADGLRVLALQGTGSQAFVSGADIAEFDQVRDGAEAGGGIGLALACDLRYASASARLRMPAARLGLGYGLADMRRLVEVTGMASAFELFYTARTLDAFQALARGLVQECFALEDFAALSRARLETIAANAPLTLRAAKAAILASRQPGSSAQAVATEALIRQCFDSADYAEGRRAFAEKRAPSFTGR
jgi:enoyl-CoA hydratase/carnithine racemase